MRKLGVIIFCAVLAGIPVGVHGDPADPVNPAGHVRGKKAGTYTLKVVGAYNGEGTCKVNPAQITITIQLKSPEGSTGTVTFEKMKLEEDRFQGSATFSGRTLTLTGRVDMPSGKDKDQTPAQAQTGRVTGNLLDEAGRGGRLVAIQDEASRGAEKK